MLRWLVTAILVVSLGLTSSCRRKYQYVESVVRTPDGNIWTSGSEGFAGYFNKQGFVKAEYPRRHRKPGYDSYPDLPAAHLSFFNESLYLFTRRAEVLRWNGNEWDLLQAKIPPNFERPQLNRVLKTPDGRLLIQIHSDSLIWARQDQLETGQVQTEKTPTYFTHLAFIGEALYGLGWTDDGNTRALRRRDGPKQWPIVATLPPREKTGILFGIISQSPRVPEPSVVTSHGLLHIRGEKTVPLSVEDLVRQADAPLPEKTSSKSYVVRLVPISGSTPLIQISGPQAGLLGGPNGEHLYWPCRFGTIAAGFKVNSKLFVVGQSGEIYELTSNQCTQTHKAFLNE